MYLKRLEVLGFKSFAERIKVDFVPGVTAVVGPNGSGKSNITDSIRWVLGEQSAKSLRGTKMEDIIFAGSESRKPLNIAEVTLTLDNSNRILPIDYMEVSVTRRVYRSGESDFLINNQSCRLKDIVDLFMDSGLGKEAFSIISQGKVEEILSSKAEERRSIFEEAAGVLKYKTRKKKAEHKLFETQENLNRVSDILHELESQVEPLQIQASIAKDFLEKKEELEKIEVGVTVFEIEELHTKWEQLSDRVKTNTEKEVDLSSSIQHKEADLEKLKNNVQALDESINYLQDALLIASSELEKLEGRKEVLKERKKNASQNRAQLEKSVVELDNIIADLKENLTKDSSILKDWQQTLKVLELDLTSKLELHDTFNQNMEETIEQLKSDYIELLNKQASIRNELTYLNQQTKQEEVKTKRLEEVNEKYIIERQSLSKKKSETLKQNMELETKINSTVDSYRKSVSQLHTLQNTLQKKEKLLYDAFKFLQQTKSRKEMLEAMQGDFAGFFQGVKEILKARDEQRLFGIKGAVVEIIQVKQDYETAIEIALGSSTQHIVVSEEQDARNAIHYLKKNGFGRATFLPMTVMKERSIPDYHHKQLQGDDAFVGMASELVHFDQNYQNIILYLLGNVIVAKDLKGANRLASIVQHRYRIVTLDGDVVNPGGSMTGGAVKQKNNSLLSRTRELEFATIKLAEIEEQASLMEEQVKVLKSKLKDEEMEVAAIKEQGETLRYEEQQVRALLKEIELEEKNINEHLSLYDYEKEQFTTAKASNIARESELNKQLAELTIEIEGLDKEILHLTNQKKEQHVTKETLQSEITNLKVDAASHKERIQNQKHKVLQQKQQLEEAENKFIEIQEDLSLLNSEMTDSYSGEKQLEFAAQEKLQDKNETIQLISSRREERLRLHEKLEAQELELKELKRQYKTLTQILKDEEVQLNRLDVELDNRLMHLREEYMLTFEAAKEQFPLLDDIEISRKRLKLIKMAMEELGTVNIAAIDEYERVSERYYFLKEQKEDLLEAKDTLYQVISEMDEEMTKRFEITFTNIRSHFNDVFHSLFGGGRADLVLTNPEDMLNTGVEIVAQPPGKKLQNLGLLSGGERALTAIALLFSILKVRPVPFCILDEVEAALDEANVHRFANYLKHYSKETQFIVITHRKGTMEQCDVLYGVTMQESGVSKLVSVRLEETKELVT
ncbi:MULTISPECIES: chromosome segregation protein SMC [Bacillus]|uniref:chromosome segregation protein SMC n=1 Tax=Bacillus TaxID=1386 RepID=UPI000BB753F2|nr:MULTISPECIES: chromosome segregation protein SMC [Bacillus]